MRLPLAVTEHWYDIRDLSNLSREILEGVDGIAPEWVVFVVSVLIGFVATFVIFVLPTQLFLGVLGERKLIGRIQSRYGPNRVGKFGVLQPIADTVKLMQKEALTPKAADVIVMNIAPVAFVIPAILLFAVIPFGPRMVVADIQVSLLFYLAVASLPVLVAFMAGWSHNNKYSLFGAMRIVAMSISYEVPLVLSLLGVVLMTQVIGDSTDIAPAGLSLQGIVLWQKEMNIWLVVLQPLAFLIFFICASAELNRTPADIAEAESEIVAGYLTEYSGIKWGLFYGMDIAYALAAAALGATVFFGGWSVFGLEKWVPSWLLFAIKVDLFYLAFTWTRGTLPRLRIDQLVAVTWKYLFPLALLNVFLVTTERMLWVDQELSNAIVYAFAAVNIAVSAVGIVVWARAIGYRPTATPTRPRLVSEARGYVPVEGGN